MISKLTSRIISSPMVSIAFDKSEGLELHMWACHGGVDALLDILYGLYTSVGGLLLVLPHRSVGLVRHID